MAALPDTEAALVKDAGGTGGGAIFQVPQEEVPKSWSARAAACSSRTLQKALAHACVDLDGLAQLAGPPLPETMDTMLPLVL